MSYNKKVGNLRKKILTLIVFLLLLASCGTLSNRSETGDVTINDDLSDIAPPLIRILYQENDTAKEIILTATTFGWSKENEEGHGVRVESDGIFPLDQISNLEPIMIQEDSFGIVFDEIPNSYTIGYWTDDNIGKGIWGDDLTELKSKDGIVKFPNKNEGYIFQICGSWSEGNAYYYVYLMAPSNE